MTTTTTRTNETDDTRQQQATAIALALTTLHDPGWIAEARNDTGDQKLVRADGSGPDFWLSFHDEKSGARLTINVLWPRDPDTYQVYTPSDRDRRGATIDITVSATKSPAQIAGDITRRLLPDAERLWRQQRDRLANHRAYEQLTAATAARVAQETGGDANERGGISWPWRSASDSPYVWSAEVSGDRVKLDLRSLSAEQAIAIIKLLQLPVRTNETPDSHEPGCDLVHGGTCCSCSPYKDEV